MDDMVDMVFDVDIRNFVGIWDIQGEQLKKARFSKLDYYRRTSSLLARHGGRSEAQNCAALISSGLSHQ